MPPAVGGFGGSGPCVKSPAVIPRAPGWGRLAGFGGAPDSWQMLPKGPGRGDAGWRFRSGLLRALIAGARDAGMVAGRVHGDAAGQSDRDRRSRMSSR